MQQYEYKCLNYSPNIEELAYLGREGWKMCGTIGMVVSLTRIEHLYFIKPIIKDKLQVQAASDLLRERGLEDAADILLDQT